MKLLNKDVILFPDGPLSVQGVYHGPQQLEKQEIGIEFVKPSPLFWRIAFPPCPRPRLDIVSAPPQ
jgi:hypothetical protein